MSQNILLIEHNNADYNYIYVYILIKFQNIRICGFVKEVIKMLN